MRVSIVQAILRKQLLELLRDKKTLLTGILLPLLLYPLLMIGSIQISSMVMEDMTAKEIRVGIAAPLSPELTARLQNVQEGAGKLTLVQTQQYAADLESESIDLFLRAETNKIPPLFTIYVNQKDLSDTSLGLERVLDILEDYKGEMVENALTAKDLDADAILNPMVVETVNLAPTEAVAGSFLGMLLPILLIMGVLLGAIYPAIETIAGEKERGTLETLFTLPVTNLELVTGKFLAVALGAVGATLINVLSVGLTGVYLFFSLGESGLFEGQTFDLGQMVLPTIITLLCLCLFAVIVSAASMCVCAFAKTYKDAQTYISPLMLVLLLPSYAAMIPNVQLTGVTAVLPVVNVSLLIKSVFSLQVDIGLMSMVFLSNTAYSILLILLLSKLFSSEEILFGGSGGFQLLERRTARSHKLPPTAGEGILLYGVGMLVLIYGGALLQLLMGVNLGTVAVQQVLVFLLPVGFVWYAQNRWQDVFPLKKFSLRYFLGALLLMGAAHLLTALVQGWMLQLFPVLQKMAEQLTNTVVIDNLPLNLLVAALMPAFAEEAFFRGYLYTAFHKKGSTGVAAVITTAALFGLFHMNVLQMVTGLLLGLVFAYVRYKSGSIILPAVLHFMNNGWVVLMSHLSEGNPLRTAYGLVMPDLQRGWIWIVVTVVVICLLTAAGMGIMTNKTSVMKLSKPADIDLKKGQDE